MRFENKFFALLWALFFCISTQATVSGRQIGFEDLLIEQLPAQEKRIYQQRIDLFIKEMRTKLALSKGTQVKQSHINKIYMQVQKQFLKKYVPYATLAQTFQTGSFDCLSGSMLYAYVFDQLDIDYQLIEMSFHIYIRVRLENKTLLLESTDPTFGLLTRSWEIEEREKKYRQDNVLLADDITPEICREITLEALNGLQWYNKALVHYNNADFLLALDALKASEKHYKGQRSTAFQTVIQQAYTALR